MPLPNYPLINGTRYSFASVVAVVGPKRFSGLKSVDYSDSVEIGKVRGNGRMQVIGRTAGEYDAEGSVEIFQEEAAEFELTLTTLGGLYIASFTLSIGFATAIGVPALNVEILGARVTKRSFSASEGPDAVSTKYDFHAMGIISNGQPPMPDQFFRR